ncbi:MAG: hypothetical protein ABI658_23625 [Acidimicrobiales bacterium]
MLEPVFRGRFLKTIYQIQDRVQIGGYHSKKGSVLVGTASFFNKFAKGPKSPKLNQKLFSSGHGAAR